MALNYAVLSEEDIGRLRCLPKGDYDFYVGEILLTKSQAKLDKDGKPKKIYDMLAVKLKIILPDNTERQVKDWVLIVGDEDAMGFKLRHFALTCGLIHKYETKQLDADDFKGKHGKVKIAVQDYTDKTTGELMKINCVVDYIKPLAANTPVDNGKPFDDDIPFM